MGDAAPLRLGGPADYASVEAALTHLLETVGTDPFAVPHRAVVRNNVFLADGRIARRPFGAGFAEAPTTRASA